jgi:group I intron endonuclease
MPRKQKKYHYLYKTTNLINNKFYVGMHSTDDLEDGYLGSGKYLRNAVNYYGKENFKTEILEFFDNREILKEKEIELVTKDFIKIPLCMNLQVGGFGGPYDSNWARTSEYRKKVSDNTKGKNKGKEPWNKGKINVISEEARRNISKSLIGNKNKKGKLASEETKNNISIAKKECFKNGIKPPDTSTQVEQYNIDNIFIAKYKSIREASIKSGCSEVCIGRVCKGDRIHTKNFIWKYATQGLVVTL